MMQLHPLTQTVKNQTSKMNLAERRQSNGGKTITRCLLPFFSFCFLFAYLPFPFLFLIIVLIVCFECRSIEYREYHANKRQRPQESNVRSENFSNVEPEQALDAASTFAW